MQDEVPMIETDVTRAERMSRERAMIAEGEADLAAGGFIEGDEADAFLDRFRRGLPAMSGPGR